MRRKTSMMVVGVLGVALALSACGDDSSSGSDCGFGQRSPARGKIGVILPDTESSVRWEASDRPALEAAFKEAGVEYDIQNAEGDAEKMTTIADGMIADGVTVLAIVNLDSESGAAIEEKAASQGVKTIDYDRLTLGGSADYYVSFDNTKCRRAPGPGPGRLPGRQGREHHLPERFAHRQQRHAVLGRCALRARPDDQLQDRR